MRQDKLQNNDITKNKKKTTKYFKKYLINLLNFLKKTKKVNEIRGSSLLSPAHGWVGARATLLFLAVHFAKQNTNSVGVQSEGEAEGGCGGNSASPEPKRGAKPRARRLIQYGGPERIRTSDPLDVNEVLYH